MSDTMRQMILRYTEQCGVMDKYSSILKIIEKTYWLVDICNGTQMSSKDVWKGYECSDSPDHENISELLSILETFIVW